MASGRYNWSYKVMKTKLLATFTFSLTSALVLAQGTVNFGSTTTAHRVLYVDDTPVGSGFTAALYWGPLGSLEGNLIQLGSTTSVNAGTGYLNGGTRTTGIATAPGSAATFQIRAWNGGFPTWEAMLASGQAGIALGKSPLFMNPTGNPNNSPPDVPAFLTGWTTPVHVFSWPEPATASLLGLGIGTLAIFRAIKKKPFLPARVPQKGSKFSGVTNEPNQQDTNP